MGKEGGVVIGWEVLSCVGGDGISGGSKTSTNGVGILSVVGVNIVGF